MPMGDDAAGINAGYDGRSRLTTADGMADSTGRFDSFYRQERLADIDATITLISSALMPS